MVRTVFQAVFAGLAATALTAQAVAQAPATPPAETLVAVPMTPIIDGAVQAFYASRPATLIWLRDPDTRVAAAKLPVILRRATLDGLDEGPELASTVEAAIARGQPADDMVLSNAWVRYVRTIKRPVEGISYGDPALALKPPAADAILTEANGARSLAAHIDQVSAINSLYAFLRDDVASHAAADDPRARATLDRLRLVPGRGRAILVDAANAELMMLEDGKVTDTMKVIVGKKTNATPLLAGTIHYVTFNPVWHIPPDVARRKVAPVILKRGVGYLKAARYQTVAAFGGDKEEPIDPVSVDWKAVAAGDTEVHIRQLSGPANMMGAMKFGFVNDYGIFLHDTPHKDLFAKAKRTLSLGCIRLEHPERLASWLLGRDPTPPGDGSEQLVQLDKGVPVYVTYLTARPGEDGAVAFADDVYGLDTPGAGKALLATASTAQ